MIVRHTQPALLRRRRDGGLTLLELLATVAIVSLVLGAVLVRLGPVQDDLVLRGAAVALQDLDGRARLHALRGQRVTFEVDSEAGVVRLVAIDTGELLAQERLPGGATLRFAISGESHSPVFTRSGRSRSYEAELAREGQSIAWRVAGATGVVSSVENEQ